MFLPKRVVSVSGQLSVGKDRVVLLAMFLPKRVISVSSRLSGGKKELGMSSGGFLGFSNSRRSLLLNWQLTTDTDNRFSAVFPDRDFRALSNRRRSLLPH
jgi:hypothetical protein